MKRMSDADVNHHVRRQTGSSVVYSHVRRCCTLRLHAIQLKRHPPSASSREQRSRLPAPPSRPKMSSAWHMMDGRAHGLICVLHKEGWSFPFIVHITERPRHLCNDRTTTAACCMHWHAAYLILPFQLMCPKQITFSIRFLF